MARNEEKHYGRLNRLILQKQKEEYDRLHPKRPRLDNLNTVDEIKQWLPSIKKDMDFYLKKSQVVCYSEEHINESRLMVEKLHREYKAFLRKIRLFSPGLGETPWTNRPYKSKEESKPQAVVDQSTAFTRLPLPILDNEIKPSLPEHQEETHLALNDKPLEFNITRFSDVDDKNISNVNPCNESCRKSSVSADDGTKKNDEHAVAQNGRAENSASKAIEHLDGACSESQNVAEDIPLTSSCVLMGKNLLGLDYDSSSGDDSTGS